MSAVQHPVGELQQQYRRIIGHGPARGTVTGVVAAFAGIGFNTLLNRAELADLAGGKDVYLAVLALLIDVLFAVAVICFVFATLGTYNAIDTVSTFSKEQQDALSQEQPPDPDYATDKIREVEQQVTKAYGIYHDAGGFVSTGVTLTLSSMVALALRTHIVICIVTLLAIAGSLARSWRFVESISWLYNISVWGIWPVQRLCSFGRKHWPA